MERTDGKHNRSGVWVGLIIVLIGLGWFLRQLNFPLPYWLFSWEMILIILGVAIGIKNHFRDKAWFILLLVGGVFLVRDIFPFLTWHNYLWPIALIVFGVFIILRPRRSHWKNYNEYNDNPAVVNSSESLTGDDTLDCTTAFGGMKKNIVSKNFKGGDVSSIFGGTELNFMQADIQGSVLLDVTQIFGGTKLIIPANWEVKSDVTAIFGGIEDKRVPAPNVDHSKVLVLNGTSIFGGIEIASY